MERTVLKTIDIYLTTGKGIEKLIMLFYYYILVQPREGLSLKGVWELTFTRKICRIFSRIRKKMRV